MTWLRDSANDDDQPTQAGAPAAAGNSTPADRQSSATSPNMAPAQVSWALIVAIIWAVAATIIGLVFILAVNAETYGGDAYTGIEKAIVTGVHAVGWVIISTGILGIIVAGAQESARRHD